MVQWYYLKDDGDQQGPVSQDELMQMAAGGELSPTDMVWKEGMADWADASKVKGLQFGSAADPLPKPASPRESAPAEPAVPEYEDLPTKIDPLTGEPVQSRGKATAQNIVPPRQLPPAIAPSAQSLRPTGGFGSGWSAARKKKPFRPKIRVTRWSSYLVIAAVMMIVSFFIPWWGMYVKLDLTEDERAETQDRMDAAKTEGLGAQESWDSFYDKFDVGPGDQIWNKAQARRRARLTTGGSGSKDQPKLKFWLVWGWQTNSGTASLILGATLLPLVIVFGYVERLQQWSWIVFFLGVISGVAMVILFSVWLLEPPDTDFPPGMRQSVIAGPWLSLIAGLINIGCGLTGAIVCLIAFVKQYK